MIGDKSLRLHDGIKLRAHQQRSAVPFARFGISDARIKPQKKRFSSFCCQLTYVDLIGKSSE